MKVKSRPPVGFKSRIPFFSDHVLPRVLATLDFASTLTDAALRDVFLIALGSVMVKVSNYSYEPSLTSRPGSGKPLLAEAPVADIVTTKLNEILEDVNALQLRLCPANIGRATVCHDSFFNATRYLGPNTVDLVITSPPYMNNYHYVRNTRPQLWWLGLVQRAQQLRTLEERSMGKFWQTVRDRDQIPLLVPLPQIQLTIDNLRQLNRERGAYGGPGWSNYVAAYFNDLNGFVETMAGILRPGAYAVIVVGNSIVQGLEIKVERFLADIGCLHGLTTDSVQIIRAKRVGSSIVDSTVRTQGQHQKTALYDAMVVLRKLDHSPLASSQPLTAS